MKFGQLKHRGIASVTALLFSVAGEGAFAQDSESGSELTVLLRLQPEFVYVDGSAADARGTDGFDLTDGWSGGNPNSGNWGGLFIDGAHQISDNTRFFARFSLNLDNEGLKDGDARNREIYAGIAGSYGEVFAGRLQSAYRVAGLSWDPMVASFLQARGNGGVSGGAFGHAGLFDRSLGYRQSLGIFDVHATLTLDDNVLNDPGSDDDHLIAASVTAPLGPVQLLGAYIDASEYEGGPKDRDAIKLGARYNQDQWSAAVIYESRGQGLEGGDFAFFTGTYRQDKWQFNANLGFFADDNDVNDGSYFALGARYQLHNLVSIHGGIRQLDRDLTGKERIAGLGFRILLNSGNLLK